MGEKNIKPEEGPMTPDERREVAEAVSAGRRALSSLEEAADALDSAVDNPFVDLYVQKKIQDADENVQAAIAATKTVLARLESVR